MTPISAERIAQAARRMTATPWRVVETQHRASTLRLVDTLDEQRVLEDLLETSKPPLPPEAAQLHYLLATPFRYPAPPPAGSRFRGIGDAGVWYGARHVHTALAEVAYWRLRFLADSPATPEWPAVAHTALRASVGGAGIALNEAPFASLHARWEDPVSYLATQALARSAREAGVVVIRYRSVRDPAHRDCVAVLSPAAFRLAAPLEQHTWLLKVTRERVLAEAGVSGERIGFEAAELGWVADAASGPGRGTR